MALSLRSFLEMLDQFRTRHRRRLAFLEPALERRRPRIAAEDYAARHSIEQHSTGRLSSGASLRPASAARRYHQLLTYELEGLREVVSALHSATEGRELEESLAETSAQIERLEIEVAWCETLLGAVDQSPQRYQAESMPQSSSALDSRRWHGLWQQAGCSGQQRSIL